MPKGSLGGVRNFELFQITREKSRKTEAVFLVGSRRSGGKSKSLRARFLLPTFSFGEAKENAEGQLQLCRSFSAFPQLNHLHYRPKNILPSRRFGTRAYCFVVPPKFGGLQASLLRRGNGLREPGDFGAERLIRMLGECPSRCCCKGLSA